METYIVYLKFLVVFPLIIVSIYFCLRSFLARFGSFYGVGRQVKVMERVALGARINLYVVKVGNGYLLLASTPNGVTLIKDLGEKWWESDYGEESVCKKAGLLSIMSTIGNRASKNQRKSERLEKHEE